MQCGIKCHDDTNQTSYKEDPVYAQVMAYCEYGWLPIITENPAMREFYQVRDEPSVEQGLLLLVSRIVIPSLLRAEILERIHMGHLGIHKCRETARRNVWWPCMSSQIADKIRACRKCHRSRPEHSDAAYATRASREAMGTRSTITRDSSKWPNSSESILNR